MKPGFLRTFGLLGALIAGVFLPQAHRALFLVPWIIVGMLFLVFLQTRFSRESVQKSHAALLALNFAMGAVGWGAGFLLGGREVALAGFFAGITPTAAAAPVVVNFLRGRTDYVITAFMLTNLVIAASFPLILPFILGQATPNLFTRVLTTMTVLVFVPLLIARVLRRLKPATAEWPKKLSMASFCAWLAALFIITANASHFLRSQVGIDHTEAMQIALLSAAICAANFALGRWIGGREFSREASQSLGQKNTSLTIYVATAYANPLVALGPTCYVLWHNLWNSWQLYRARHAHLNTEKK